MKHSPKMLFLKPKSGVLVKDPITRTPLAEAGEWKPQNTYWRRRINDKDAIVSEPSAPPAPPIPADEPATPAVQKA